MLKHLCRFFCFLLFLSLLPEPAIASCSIPGSEVSCGELVSELPWLFIIHVKESQPIRITYMSLQGNQQSNPNLNMFLEINDHENREAAAKTFSQMRQQADPDMGLSYAWDQVLIRDKQIYHLHADCTLAEQYFTSMGKALERIIKPSGEHLPQSFFCRCGGGCKLAD